MPAKRYAVLALSAVCVAMQARNARAALVQAPLDPDSYASIGTVVAEGSYTFNTGNGTSTPTLTEQTISGPATTVDGVISNGVAVFDFDTFRLDGNSVATATGSLPLAVLSRTGVSINGSFNVSANGTTGGPGAFQGSSSMSSTGAGGGYGGFGGSALGGSSNGGGTYGDSGHVFQGGTGGGSGSSNSGSVVGAGGGGALELSAESDILISDTSISADGGNGASEPVVGSGGGSGGGLFLATPGDVTIYAASLSAAGGSGGSSALSGGGGGGGGRILVEADDFIETGFASVDVASGAGGSGGPQQRGDAGEYGTFQVADYVSPVPEPAFLSMLSLAGLRLLKRRRRV